MRPPSHTQRTSAMKKPLRLSVALVLATILGPLAAAQCTLSFVGTVTATYSSPPRLVVFAGTVANAGTGTKQAGLRVRFTGQGLAGSFQYGPAALGPSAGTPFSVTQSIPNTAPLGIYTLFFELLDLTGGPPGVSCGLQTTTVTVVPPRLGMPEDLSGGVDFHPATDGLFASSAPAAAAPAIGVHVSPNPFSAQTTLTFTLSEAASVRVAVYDALGREAAVLIDETREAGEHAVLLDASALPAGVYVVRMTTGAETAARRVTVVR